MRVAHLILPQPSAAVLVDEMPPNQPVIHDRARGPRTAKSVDTEGHSAAGYRFDDARTVHSRAMCHRRSANVRARRATLEI